MSDLPWLMYSSRFSVGTNDQSYYNPLAMTFPVDVISTTPLYPPILTPPITYLVKVYHRLPELVLRLVEVSHSDLPKVPRMVPVEICSVVVLTTSHTTSTGMLAVLSDTTVTGGDMTAAVLEEEETLAL